MSRPDSDALSRLAVVWAAGGSGAVRSEFIEGRAVLLRGEPRDDVDLRWLERACRAGPLHFQPASDFGQTQASSMQRLLLGLASELANPAVVRRCRHALLVDGPAARALHHLNIPPEVTRLLSVRSEGVDLEGLLQRSGVDPAAIWQDLAVLISLGVLKLRIVPGAQPYPETAQAPPRRGPPKKRTRPDRQRPAPTTNRQRKRKPPDSARVLARLEREWRLLEDATDHVVLGISPDMTDEVVRKACRRMSRRYAKLAAQTELEPEARELARRIHERVRVAIERIRTGQTMTAAPAPFERGQEAIRQGDWEVALKCFALARKQDDDPRNLAWFGWAMYNDPSRPEGRRQDKGREHMKLAESMSVNSPDATFLLARADVHEEHLESARTRLDRLTRQFPDHAGARQLMAQVQKDMQT